MESITKISDESPDILTFQAKLGTFWNAYQACNHADSSSGGSKPGIVTQMNSKWSPLPVRITFSMCIACVWHVYSMLNKNVRCISEIEYGIFWRAELYK